MNLIFPINLNVYYPSSIPNSVVVFFDLFKILIIIVFGFGLYNLFLFVVHKSRKKHNNSIHKSKLKVVVLSFIASFALFLITLMLSNLILGSSDTLFSFTKNKFNQRLIDYCQSFDSNSCPKDKCQLQNLGGGPGLGYVVGCWPK